MISVVATLGSIFLAAVTFLIGRSVSETEKVLQEKRRVYEMFLLACPRPNSAYSSFEGQFDDFEEIFPVLLLYSSPNVALAANQYLNLFQESQDQLCAEPIPLHPAYREVAKAHNDLILEMRRDCMSWSTFGYRGRSRIPADALEKAKSKAL